MTKNYDLAVWDGAKMQDVLAHAKGLGSFPDAVHLHIMDYMDLRKLARDVMTANTKAGPLKEGLMGTVYGVSIYAGRDCVKGVISVLGKGGSPLSHVVNLRRWRFSPDPSHSLHFHPGLFSSCEDELCIPMFVMDS